LNPLEEHLRQFFLKLLLGWYLWVFTLWSKFLPLYKYRLSISLPVWKHPAHPAAGHADEMLKEATAAPAALCGVVLGSTEESQGFNLQRVGKQGEFLRECQGNIGNHMED